MHIAHYVQHIVRGAYAIEEVVKEVQSATQLHLKGTGEGDEEGRTKKRREKRREEGECLRENAMQTLTLSLSRTHTASNVQDPQ